MKRVVMFALVAAIAVMSTAEGLACGDKFFVPGRGASFLPTPAQRKAATVLVYAPPASALSQTIARLKSEAALHQAGYQPVVVTAKNELAGRATTTWDVILVSADDGDFLKGQIPLADSTHLVAILENATKVQLSMARDQFPAVLKSPARNQDLLDVIDQATVHAISDRAKSSKGR
jgi:hypothetical protein